MACEDFSTHALAIDKQASIKVGCPKSLYLSIYN